MNTKRVMLKAQHEATPIKPMKRDIAPRNTIDAPSVKEFSIMDVVMRRWMTRALGDMSMGVAGAVMISSGAGVLLDGDDAVRPSKVLPARF